MKILKFGGTSVGSANRIKKLVPLVKQNQSKIVVLSAISGTTNQLGLYSELIRPALYQASHKIINISSIKKGTKRYDVVGPICESSDCFGKQLNLPETQRGDCIIILSCGAYGQVMASQYNLRSSIRSYYFNTIS